MLLDLREGGLVFTSIMLYESVAMVIGESHALAMRGDVATSSKFRLVAVYQQADKNWQLSYFQSTEVTSASR